MLGYDGTEFYKDYGVTNGELNFYHQNILGVIDMLETGRQVLYMQLQKRLKEMTIEDLTSKQFDTLLYFQNELDRMDDLIKSMKEYSTKEYIEGYSKFMIEHNL